MTKWKVIRASDIETAVVRVNGRRIEASFSVELDGCQLYIDGTPEAYYYEDPILLIEQGVNSVIDFPDEIV